MHSMLPPFQPLLTPNMEHLHLRTDDGLWLEICQGGMYRLKADTHDAGHHEEQNNG
jgi:hypothetical protein